MFGRATSTFAPRGRGARGSRASAGRARIGPDAARVVGDRVKDTVIAYPGLVTRVKTRFNTPRQFVWHCHIDEHEDNEMMRPYRIGPTQPGQPDRPA
jgi:FtsP/CotA-like multicopper oxidase with cupredoxin domain